MSSSSYEVKNLAEEIVGILPSGTAVRVCSEDRETIRYAVRAPGLELESVVLRRSSLARLLTDAFRDVKVEYLKRDILRTGASRPSYQYPRPTVAPRPERLAMPAVATV